VTAAAILALVMAVANVVAALAGADVADGGRIPFTIVSTAVLVMAGIGMLRVRYWAVLGFQAVLAFQIITLALALVRVERWWVGALVALVALALGYLFWKLVRAMARIQLPERGRVG